MLRTIATGERFIFSADVEDWFHILDVPGTPDFEAWGRLPSRVEDNFRRLLALLATHNAKITCFFLGWVAERFPRLVREAVNQGHEIASHGYAHRLVYTMTPDEFGEDARRSREILEQVSGFPVLGYRAAGFSCTGQTPWLFEELVNAGYQYDSSIFPASRGHGGMPGAPLAPHRVVTPSGTLVEFPATVATVLGTRLCFFGGGYLRLFPTWLIKGMARRVCTEQRPVVFYVHPRELDPAQPRLPMRAHRRFKTYVNLRSTEGKIASILSGFPWTTFRGFLAEELGPVSDAGVATTSDVFTTPAST
jgi:polysaccharide deacetylase family protein (PEP-CTERM system associated)